MILSPILSYFLKQKKYVNYANDYIKLEHNIKHSFIISQSEKINPPYKIQLGDDFNSIIKKFSNSFLKYHIKLKNLKVLFFKIKTHDIKLYCKVHFYHNKVFLIQYRAPYITDSNFKQLEAIFNIQNLDEKTIKNDDENFISITNNVNLTIHFIDKEILYDINKVLFYDKKANYSYSSIKRAYSYE